MAISRSVEFFIALEQMAQFKSFETFTDKIYFLIFFKKVQYFKNHVSTMGYLFHIFKKNQEGSKIYM